MKEHVQNYEIWTARFVTARCYAESSYATVYCLSVRPSVCNVQVPYRDHIGWNSSKIIPRTNSLRPPLWLTPTLAIWCTFIRSITTTVINNFGKSSRGRSQGLSKFFRASTYRAHRAVNGHLCDSRAFLSCLGPVCLFYVFGVFSLVCFELSVPVQVTAWKDSSPK